MGNDSACEENSREQSGGGERRLCGEKYCEAAVKSIFILLTENVKNKKNTVDFFRRKRYNAPIQIWEHISYLALFFPESLFQRIVYYAEP